MTSRIPDEEVTPELQALWSLRNDLRLARAEASRADNPARLKFEQVRAAALEHAVAFAEEAVRVARLSHGAAETLRAQSAALSKIVNGTVP